MRRTRAGRARPTGGRCWCPDGGPRPAGTAAPTAGRLRYSGGGRGGTAVQRDAGGGELPPACLPAPSPCEMRRCTLMRGRVTTCQHVAATPNARVRPAPPCTTHPHGCGRTSIPNVRPQRCTTLGAPLAQPSRSSFTTMSLPLPPPWRHPPTCTATPSRPSPTPLLTIHDAGLCRRHGRTRPPAPPPPLSTPLSPTPLLTNHDARLCRCHGRQLQQLRNVGLVKPSLGREELQAAGQGKVGRTEDGEGGAEHARGPWWLRTMLYNGRVARHKRTMYVYVLRHVNWPASSTCNARSCVPHAGTYCVAKPRCGSCAGAWCLVHHKRQAKGRAGRRAACTPPTASTTACCCCYPRAPPPHHPLRLPGRFSR